MPRGIQHPVPAVISGMSPLLEPAPVFGALDRALAALDWTLRESTHLELAAGERMVPSPDAGFSYLIAGSAAIRIGEHWTELAAGDLLFYPRGARREIRAREAGSLLDATVVPAATTRNALTIFPDALSVTGFREREPNLARLIESMACGPATAAAPGRVTTAPRRDGDIVVCSLIATTIISASVRLWAELGCAPERWLHRVSDPYIARALDALHADPGHPWSVQELARVATMSRSSFAERFHGLVGKTPASYLTGVRMEESMGLLLREGLSIADTARRLGYESEAGFSRAFRRHTGQTPALWREGHRAA